MVDPQQAIDKARKAVTERAELPGMSLMEHLEELRKRIVHSADLSRPSGFFVCWFFRTTHRQLLSGCRSTSSASSSASPTPWIR